MKLTRLALSVVMTGILSSCSGGSGGGGDSEGTAPPDAQDVAAAQTVAENAGQTISDSVGCIGFCINANSFLSTTEVELIIAQGVSEAQARGVNGTFAVVDRVGNVLAVFQMNGADTDVTITSGTGTTGGLENLTIIPSTLAAIAKAVTAAYLSSEGNAFTTRTASQIVQDHFNPGEFNQPGGPLFGVQFSQLPCSDFSSRFTAGADFGPKRSPLGLSADPGGFPLYKDGTVVGGVGAAFDGIYGLDLSIGDVDANLDELIAFAATFGFAAPADRQATRSTVDGKTLRFSDIDFDDAVSILGRADAFATITGGVVGNLVAVTGYTDGATLAGTIFTQAASGIVADTDNDFPGLDAFVFVNGAGNNRFPPIAGTAAGASSLTENEVRTILQEALLVANRARSQLRQPVGSQARVTVSIVDTDGTILGVARTRDAPIFGSDVAVQKARTAAFFSGADAATELQGADPANYINDALAVIETIILGDYVDDLRTFLVDVNALTGTIAFTDRANGNLSRPFFADGIDGNPNGPFSKITGKWSIFSTGLQLDISYNNIITHIAFVLGVSGIDTLQDCTGFGGDALANGAQIFPGSVPIYRGSTLIGGIGVSGDGVDQDDMVGFLGISNAETRLDGSINQAPAGIRADNLVPNGVRLRYVNCPQAPFLDTNDDNVCDGL